MTRRKRFAGVKRELSLIEAAFGIAVEELVSKYDRFSLRSGGAGGFVYDLIIVDDHIQSISPKRGDSIRISVHFSERVDIRLWHSSHTAKLTLQEVSICDRHQTGWYYLKSNNIDMELSSHFDQVLAIIERLIVEYVKCVPLGEPIKYVNN